MTASATDGRGPNPPELASHFPIGYPLLLSSIDRAGLLGQAAVVLVNVLSLLLGLAAACSLLQRDFHLSRRAALTCCLLTAASWVMVKHTPLPVTDVVFFGLALAVLWLLSTAAMAITASGRTGRYWLLMATAVALSLGATLVRTAGISLAFPILFALLGGAPGLSALFTSARRNSALSLALITLALIALAGAAFALRDSPYIHAFLKQPAAPTEGKAFGPSWRLLEAGQLTLNLPVAVIESLAASAGTTAATLAPWAIRAIGAITLAAALAGAWSLRRSLSVSLVFVAGYLALVAMWPYQDPRFLLPILPLACGLVVFALPSTPRLARPIFFASLTVVALHLGLSAIGFSRSIALTFAGPRFADLYGSQRLANSYRAAWDLPLNSALPTMPIKPFVDTLRRYDRRGQRASADHQSLQRAAEELNTIQHQQQQQQQQQQPAPR